jgi:hypothetical protein
MVQVNWSEVRRIVAQRWMPVTALLIAFFAYSAFVAFWRDFDTIGVAIIQQLAALRTHT